MPYAEVNDIRMFYEETGTGQPLILMHGGTGGIDAMTGWPRLTGPLARRYHVVSVEHRGHGRTNNPANSLSYALIADDMAKFIEVLGLGPAHLAGVSDGAVVGLALAMARPDLLRSLVCIGAHAYVDDQLASSIAFYDPDHLERHHPAFVEIFQARHDPNAYPGYWRDLVRMVRSTAESELVWTRQDLAGVLTPVLLVYGENDAFVSRRQMLDLRDWLPNSELLILNRAGQDGLTNHIPQHTRSNVVERVMLGFLARHS